MYIYIKIMRCKIVRTQKLMWRNIMRSTKSQKVSILYYSIDIIYNNKNWVMDIVFMPNDSM